MKRGEQPYGQAHYDLVVLNPDFLRSHDAETVTNQRSKDQVEHPQPPLVADVEVRLFIQSWKPEEDALVGQDLANLRLALEIPPDASAPYMCVFCRDASSQPEDPENYRLAVERLLAQYPHTEFVVAACWPQHESESFVHYSGPWITTVTA